MHILTELFLHSSSSSHSSPYHTLSFSCHPSSSPFPQSSFYHLLHCTVSTQGLSVFPSHTVASAPVPPSRSWSRSCSCSSCSRSRSRSRFPHLPRSRTCSYSLQQFVLVPMFMCSLWLFMVRSEWPLCVPDCSYMLSVIHFALWSLLQGPRARLGLFWSFLVVLFSILMSCSPSGHSYSFFRWYMSWMQKILVLFSFIHVLLSVFTVCLLKSYSHVLFYSSSFF